MKKTALITGWIISTVLIIVYTTQIPESEFHGIVILGYILFLILWYIGLGINIIKEWERRPVLFLGKWKNSYGPGFVFIDPLFHNILPDIPVQDVVMDIEADKVQTKDNVRVSLVGVITYRINPDNVKDAVVEVGDIYSAIKSRALSTLTDEGAQNDLDHVLENRVAFSKKILETLTERTKNWGVKIKAFEIRDFKIGDTAIEQAIAMKAKAQKEGEAELKRAEMQLKVGQALNDAAKTLSAEGWKFKALETLIEMTRSAQNNSILIPVDLNSTLSAAFTKLS